jgi:L-lactate dehydrogenase complex protein LldF
MTVHATSPQFKSNARRALDDVQLQRALANVKTGFTDRRQAAADKLPEFELLRDASRDIKNHTLAHLDLYLEAYEARVTAAGGHVHYARTAQEARDIALSICHAPAPARSPRASR